MKCPCCTHLFSPEDIGADFFSTGVIIYLSCPKCKIMYETQISNLQKPKLPRMPDEKVND